MSPEDNERASSPSGQEPRTVMQGDLAAPAPPRGRQRTRVDLTTGSVPKKLFGQAWPQVTEQILNISDQLVDMFWAGRLPGGFRAIASVGVAQTFTQFASQARQGFDIAVRAMISRAVGAGDIPLANHILFQGLCITAIYSIVMVMVGVFLTDIFLSLINASEALREEAGLYMQIQFIGNGTQSFRMSTGSALQAAGDPIVPLRATTVSRLLHVVLAPLLIYGWWIFPQMGLPGAAMATVLGQTAGIAMNTYALFTGQSRIRLHLRGNRIDPALMWRQVKIGAPAAIRGTERATSHLALLGIAASFGDVALAAYTFTRRLENLASFGSGGLAQASGVMVGQNLGAGHVGRARSVIRWGLLYVCVVKGALITVFWLFPHGPVMVFMSDPAAVNLTVQWVRIQLFGAFFQGLMMVYQESFMGAGDTMVPMIVTLIGVWVFEVPLAWFLCTQTAFGPMGIAVAAIAGFSTRFLMFAVYYFSGRWLRIKVI